MNLTDTQIIGLCARFYFGQAEHAEKCGVLVPGGTWWNPLRDWRAAGQLLVKAAELGLECKVVGKDSQAWEAWIGRFHNCFTYDPLRAVATAVARYQSEQGIALASALEEDAR